MMTTEEFILAHRNDDVRTLALKAPRDSGIDISRALDQIAGWQKARRKLPSWAAKDGITYPPHISMEQCSSEQTALYKAAVARRLLASAHTAHHTDTADTLTDLTGGFGVDFAFMAPAFRRAVCVERQSHLCEITEHNLSVLGISHAEVINADSEQHLRQMEPCTIIYADPARRDSHGARTFAVSDCTPDVLGMKDTLLDKAGYVMLKLSPMLDWRKAAADFGRCAGEVHIVSSAGECKELLLVLSRHYDGLRRIFCADDGGTLSYTPAEAAEASGTARALNIHEMPGCHLYEPNPSVMKAGCFTLIERRYNVTAVSRDSHLFVSRGPAAGFPGRGFTIQAVTTMNKKELKATLGTLRKANITTRNFPLKADALRRRLRLADGGDTYIFATTLQDGTHVLAVCEKSSC